MSKIKPNKDIIEINIAGWKSNLPVVKFIENKGKLVNENMRSVANTKYDPWKYEIYEQYLAYKWIHENDNVLELGGRLGFVSITINSRLKNKHNHIVVESNTNVIKALRYNKKKSKSKFKILNKKISNKSLVYSMQDTQFSNLSKDNITPNKIITLQKIYDKYDFKFNVVISYSEIFLENFLVENENILNYLNLIIFKKDNTGICNYINIYQLFKQYKFIFREGLINNTDNPEKYIHQVWSK